MEIAYENYALSFRCRDSIVYLGYKGVKDMAEGRKIPTGIIVGGGVAAAVITGTLIYLAARAWAAPPGKYACPYCGATFSTLEELQDHVRSAHPGERIPIEGEWE